MVMGAAIASSRAKKQNVAAAPAPTQPASTGDNIEQLKQLAELRDQGILTEEEFAAKKKKLLCL
jgi:predicted Zn-dependent peptidase